MLNSTIRNLSCSSRSLIQRGSYQAIISKDKKLLATSPRNGQKNKDLLIQSKTNNTNSDSHSQKQENKYQYQSKSFFNRFTAGIGAAIAAIVAPFSFISMNSYCLNSNNTATTASLTPYSIMAGIEQRLSITQISANNPIEDRYCAAVLKQLDAFYISVFDGHGGWQLSQFARKQLHLQLNKILLKSKDDDKKDDKQKTIQAITQAFDIVEQKFLEISRTCFKHGFSRAGYVGACALVTLIKNNKIYCANAGDCEAIIVSKNKDQEAYSYKQMTYAFTSNNVQEQQRLKKEFPNQQDIVKCKHQNACYVKGRLMPTRAFGDFALKHKDFNFTQYSHSQGYRHPIPNYTGPYITHKPDIKVHQINKDQDKFMIMASDGLWDELSHKDATDIIQKVVSEHGEVINNQTDALRHKISKKLLEKALQKAAKDRGVPVDDMLQIPLGKRRSFHDDITIAVVDLTN